jgi:predicted metalloprotease
VNQPGFDDSGDAASRRTEQQADCLSGVWAHAAAAAGKLDQKGFATVQRREIQAVSTLPTPKSLGGFNEVRTHGTVQQRVSALTKGLDSGNPSSCGLVAQ